MPTISPSPAPAPVTVVDGFAVVSRHYKRTRADSKIKRLRELQRLGRQDDSDGRAARAQLSRVGVVYTDRLRRYKKGRWDARYFVVIDNHRRLV